MMRYLVRVHGKYGRRAPRRYRNLLMEIRRQHCRTILEIGVYRAIRSVEMIETALLAHPPEEIEYFGFDLFEDLSEELCVKEFSKKPSPMVESERLLRATGVRIHLFKGFSQETLPRFVGSQRAHGPEIDLVFIDGGHAIETIASDWDNASKLMSSRTVVLFDDYYVNTDPEVREVGCRRIVDALDRSRFDVRILEPEDAFEKEWGTLRIRLARVSVR